MTKGTKKGRKKGRKKAARVRRMLWLMFFTAAFGAFCAMLIYGFVIISGNRYLTENIDKLELPEASIVYDRNGNEAMKLFYLENREIVKLEEMPERLKMAFIATEDQRFEQHEGIDLWAIGRALVKDIIHRKAVEGGSTITQQLAKNLFLSNEKTLFRKATEASIALALEDRLTKDEILELYLNRIYFGNAAYGVKAAAKTYFGKSDLNDLTLAEMATLAAIPKAPNSYNPLDHPERARERRNTVLMLMAQQGIISEEEKRAAQSEEVKVVSGTGNRRFPSYLDYVIREAMEVTGLTEEQLHLGGYGIYTALDVKAQAAMEEAYRDDKRFPKDGPEQQVQSAMVMLDNKDGGIVAMIGGRDYVRKGLNRALIKRQPGSAFKPIAVFAPAIETGKWNPHSLLSNEKQSFGNYSPRNLDGKYGGRMTMLEAARRSVNMPAVWLLNEIGAGEGLQFAKKLGIEMSAEDRNLSIALGGLTHGASPLEMARAYSAFANQGILRGVHAITEIKDKNGKTVYAYKGEEEHVMKKETAWYTTLLLKEVVERGTGGKARIANHEVAGKTGTTQSGIEGIKGNRDVWFVGYTRDYTAAVWMGFDKTDEKHVLSDSSGTAAALFSHVVGKALEGRKPTRLEKPEGVKEPKNSEIEPPAGLTAEYAEEQGGVQLSWMPGADGLEYRLYRKSSEEDEFVPVLQTAKTSVLDIAVWPGLTYEYYVTAYHPEQQKESAPSERVNVAVPGEADGLMPGEGFFDGELSGEDLPDGFPDGFPDGRLPDTGLPDAGLPDAGFPGGGLPGGGLPDTGTPDAGLPDGELPDAGRPDGEGPAGGAGEGGAPDGRGPDGASGSGGRVNGKSGEAPGQERSGEGEQPPGGAGAAGRDRPFARNGDGAGGGASSGPVYGSPVHGGPGFAGIGP